jgi:molybdenum cofactor synthesis domain-containing protein
MTTTPTACVLIIGNEILSGRTQDINLNYLAVKLGAAGIPVREARVVPDIPEEIIEAVNACRKKYTYVFTTGGIGPTHDDITSEYVAKAFGVPLERNPVAMKLLEDYYAAQGVPVNEARARMANIPRGAKLIDNPVSKAPGFNLENVYVLAGVPKIMQTMFDSVLPTLSGGPPVVMKTVTCEIREGDLAADLEAIAKRYPSVDIGSYPNVRAGKFITQLISKGSDAAAVMAANDEVVNMVKKLGGVPEVA